MRRRLSTRVDKLKVKTIRVQTAPMVTLDSPEDDAELARDAFVRLTPQEDMSEDDIESWRDSVAKVAKAVKVIPPPKSADVPLEAGRIEEDEEVGTIREEAVAVAQETEKEEVVKQTLRILDEVGA